MPDVPFNEQPLPNDDDNTDDTDDDATDDFQQNDPDDINPLALMKDDEELPGDYGTPFSPPSGVQDRIDDTAPMTDSNIIPQQRYDEGIEGAAGIDLPGEAADEDDDIPETL
ncbi:MAG: hypothetical protein JWS12_837 [Candidatus Saccharibacteria bacterium]|nr:hypothetical protein [Candidatus Saccharibacteria bacterium]